MSAPGSSQDPAGPRFAKVVAPASDLNGLVAFYSRVLGLALKFQDGDRYAEFEKYEVSLSLTASVESVAGDAVALAFAVADLEGCLTLALAAGARVVAVPQQGPHEVRAVIEDPSGNQVIVYQKTL